MFYITTLLPQERFNMISRLNFSWRGLHRAPVVERAENQTFYDESWSKIWGNIAALEGLTHLWVGLSVSDSHFAQWTLHEDDILLPVKRVTRPQNFVLETPFAPNPQGRIRGELGHRIFPVSEPSTNQ